MFIWISIKLYFHENVCTYIQHSHTQDIYVQVCTQAYTGLHRHTQVYIYRHTQANTCIQGHNWAYGCKWAYIVMHRRTGIHKATQG